jgi:hypothetical protein
MVERGRAHAHQHLAAGRLGFWNILNDEPFGTAGFVETYS